MLNSTVDIYEAAFSGDIKRLREILQVNIELINEKDIHGRTALHRAASNGWLECVTLLVDKGADVNSVDLCGLTPLHTAASNGYTSIVRYLITTASADWSIKSLKGSSVYDIAYRRRQLRVIALLTAIENCRPQ